MAARVSEVTLFVQCISPKAEVARHASAGLFSPSASAFASFWRAGMTNPRIRSNTDADLGRRRRRKIPASVRGQAPETDCTQE